MESGDLNPNEMECTRLNHEHNESTSDGAPLKKRTRRIGKWSKEELLKLISLIEERSLLWDITKAEYRDRVRRVDEILNIAIIINKERSEIEAQWSNLRGQFRDDDSGLLCGEHSSALPSPLTRVENADPKK